MELAIAMVILIEGIVAGLAVLGICIYQKRRREYHKCCKRDKHEYFFEFNSKYN
jgi:hypothetical protein